VNAGTSPNVGASFRRSRTDSDRLDVAGSHPHYAIFNDRGQKWASKKVPEHQAGAMREYLFTLTYDSGVHPVRDAFIRHPDVVATALDISITHDSGWRIERLTGPTDSLDRVERVYFDHRCNDCSYPTDKCDAEFEYETLEAGPTTRTIYRHGLGASFCSSLGYLALKHLGRGLIFDATQRGPRYEWRLLVPDGRDVGGFRESLLADLPDGVTLDVDRIGDLEDRIQAGTIHPTYDVSYEQRQALESAWKQGYYAHPREATLEAVAAELEVPTTTFRYRLRRAEAAAVDGLLQRYNASAERISE
jgi:hypothetical protein